jgi:hypothetical protein
MVLATALIAVAAISAAAADDGCDRFAWPLSRERAMFAADRPALSSGAALSAWPAGAVQLNLTQGADTAFEMTPERPMRDARLYSGVIRFAAPARSGIYQVTVYDDGWIDFVQDGRYARAVGSTGRRDCPGLRKSVRVELSASPFVFQISNVEGPAVSVVIAPVE